MSYYCLLVCLLKKSLESDEYGKHLLGVQDLIKKHTLAETDIATLTDRASQLKKQVYSFTCIMFESHYVHNSLCLK